MPRQERHRLRYGFCCWLLLLQSPEITGFVRTTRVTPPSRQSSPLAAAPIKYIYRPFLDQPVLTKDNYPSSVFGHFQSKSKKKGNRSKGNNNAIQSRNGRATTSSNSNYNATTTAMNANRNWELLYAWAVKWGVQFAQGIQFLEDYQGDWSVTMNEPQANGTPLVTVPNSIILSSKDFEKSKVAKWFLQATKQSKEHRYLDETEAPVMSQPQYVPEYLLMVRLLEELALGEESTWYGWLQALPTDFSTAINWDMVEQTYARKMAPTLVDQHLARWKDCQNAFVDILYGQGGGPPISGKTQRWLLVQNVNEVLKWVFDVVFTRSWRTPGGKYAIIVPVADMFNHHATESNVKPCFRLKDDVLQLCMAKDIFPVGGATTNLKMSYGLNDHPARFLVTFGFCDVTAPFVDAHMGDFLKDDALVDVWPTIDPTKLVVSTQNGAMSDEVWKVFLYIVLQQNAPWELERIKRVQDCYDECDETAEDIEAELMQRLLKEWKWTVTLEIQAHLQRVLESRYPEINVSEEDLERHPHLPMILKHSRFMIDTFADALRLINTELQDDAREEESQLEDNFFFDAVR